MSQNSTSEKTSLKIVRRADAETARQKRIDEPDFAASWNRLKDSVECNISPVMRFVATADNGLPQEIRNNIRGLATFIQELPPFFKDILKENAKLRDRVSGLELQNEELTANNKQLFNQLFERVAKLEQGGASWIKAA